MPVLATLVSAVLYGLAFPPVGWHLLGWVDLVPLLVAIRCGRRAVAPPLLAWAWLLVMASTVGDALPRAVANYYGQTTLFGVCFAVALFSLHGAPYYMAFAVWYRALDRVSGAVLPLLTAAAWVALELGRVKFLTGNPWALAGYSQVRTIWSVQVADLTGIYGTSFVLVAVNAGLAEIWLALRGGRPLGRAFLGLALAGLVAGSAAAYGTARLREARPPTPERPSAAVAVVQGNLDLGSQWREEFYGENLAVYLRLTSSAMQRGRPLVVFWPENAMTFLLEEEPGYRKAIARILEPAAAQLVAGGPGAADGDLSRYYNSAFLVTPAGEIAARYDKEHLLPFAEYFPLAQLDFLTRRFARARWFAPGSPTPPLPTAAGRAGVLICNEAVFSETARARVRAGAQYLVNLANDSWLGDRSYALRVLDLVSVRAIEQRRFLVRASTSGPSAIVDPWGRVQAQTLPDTRGTMLGEIRPGDAVTLYYRLGDAFADGCLAVSLAALLGRRIAAKAYCKGLRRVKTG